MNNNNNIKDNLDATEAIIGRLKDALGVKSDGQMANYLGISRQNIGAARKRDDVPPGWLSRVAELTGCSMDWLRFGQGQQMRADYLSGETSPRGRIASPQSPYDLPVGKQAGSGGELPQDNKVAGFGAVVEMVAKIYGSGDNLLITALNANLRAFCEAIERRRGEQNACMEIENLKKRLTRIEAQVEEGGAGGKKKPK